MIGNGSFVLCIYASVVEAIQVMCFALYWLSFSVRSLKGFKDNEKEGTDHRA